MSAKDSKLRYGPHHTNLNMIVAIDIRVGGEDVLCSDLLEVCAMPLNHSYKPHPEFPPFNLPIKPSYPVDLKIAGLSRERFADEFLSSAHDAIKVGELFCTWWKAIRPKPDKKIIPFVWDWHRVQPWLDFWLGGEYLEIFHETHRELMSVMHFLNDREDYYGNDIFYKMQTFGNVVTNSGTELLMRNNLMANCKALSDCYRSMLHKR
jgi:hypothetical protein